jgi:hypothetical protein
MYLARHGDGDPELAHTKLHASSTLFEIVGAQRDVERILARKVISEGGIESARGVRPGL